MSELPLQEILSSLGLSIIDCGDYWKFSSPWRRDRDPSCICYKSNGYTIDFGGNFRGGIKQFVYAVKGNSFNKEFPELALDSLSWVRNVKKTDIPRGELRIPVMSISGRIDRVYDSPEALRYCYSRNMTDQFITDFDLSYLSFGYVNGSKMPWTRRLMIPIKENGKILSIEGRDITRQQANKALYPKGCTTSTLFNFDNLDKTKPLVIVEGIMDLVMVWRVYKNVTCTFGIQLTHRQKNLIQGFSEVILLPDSDEGGERFIDILDSFYENEFFVAKVPEKDPGDSTEDHVLEALENKKSITRYLLEVTGGISKQEKLLW